VVPSPESDECTGDLVISWLVPRFVEVELDKHRGSSALASAHPYDIKLQWFIYSLTLQCINRLGREKSNGIHGVNKHNLSCAFTAHRK